MNLKEHLEQKYSTILEDNIRGYRVPGVLGIIYEDSEEKVQQRLNFMFAMASVSWENRDTLLNLTDSDIKTKTKEEQQSIIAQINFAKDVIRKPEIEIYEKSLFEDKYFIVFNDFFSDACV